MKPIYCEHFGLMREPFNVTPTPNFIYLSDSHRESLRQLLYGIKARRGLVVLTGEVGTGKTTLIHCLLDELNGTTRTAVLFNMIVNRKQLFRLLCDRFGVVSGEENNKNTSDYVFLLERFLHESYRKGENVALIIDEAQDLPTEVLENVRLLSNFETSDDKLLQIVLVGQPELGPRLNESRLRQIKQRVALRHHLKPLNPSQCKEYMARRLNLAGGNLSVFTDDAVQAVYSYSAGIPRLINILCDNGLLTAYRLCKSTVDTPIIEGIAQDLQLTMSERNVIVVKEAVILEPADTARRDVKKETVHSIVSAGPQESPGQVPASIGPVIPDHSPSAVPPPRKRVESEISVPSQSRRDIVSSQFFDHMIHLLTEAMGPMAFFVVCDHIAAMGESLEAFPKQRLGQLVDETSREILSSPLKARFRQVISQEISG